MKFLSLAPGAIWTILIVFLALLGDWLSTYFGAYAFIPPIAGLLIAVIVPTLKVLAENAQAKPGALRDAVPLRDDAFRRWLL